MFPNYVYCARCGGKIKRNTLQKGWRYAIGRLLCPSCVEDFKVWLNPPLSSKPVGKEVGQDG